MRQGISQADIERSATLRAEGKTWAHIGRIVCHERKVSARAAMRIAHGWTQEQAAEKWNQRWPYDRKSAKYFSYWETWPASKKVPRPSLQSLTRLAALYECGLDDLLADIDYSTFEATATTAAVSAAATMEPVERRAPHSTSAHATHEPQPHLDHEATLVEPLDLAGIASASDVGNGTIEVVQESVDLLCRAYASGPPTELRDRARTRLTWIAETLGRRLSLQQHTELLIGAGWLAALLGCVHYDLGEREQAEAARQAAARFAREAGHGELDGWSHEMAAWFALTEGRWEDLLDAARAGQAVAGRTSAAVQLILQEAKGHAHLGNARAATEALGRGGQLLDQLPNPGHADHHFVFDRTKWSFYAATIHAIVGDTNAAEEHASVVLSRHLRADGTTDAPMRVADTRIDLAMVHLQRGDLDAATDQAHQAFGHARKSLPGLLRRGNDFGQLLASNHPNDRRTAAYLDRLRDVRQTVATS